MIRSLEYGYDAANMITNVSRENGESTAYVYDSLYRLTGVTQTSNSTVTSDADFVYDLVGNRLMQTENGVATTNTLGQGNRLATFGAEGATYQDAAGCVTAQVFDATSRVDLAWNSQYQVTAASVNGTVMETYGYDAVGRRVYTVQDGVTNWLVYAGNQVVADLDGTGGMIRSYVWGPGIDNLLAMTVYANSGGTTSVSSVYYAIKDHLNSVLALTDASGQIIEQYRYDAWGRTTVFDGNGNPLTTSAIGNRYLWQGREYSWKIHAANGGTGLYYFRARWYDPITGRWLSNDPIGISGGLNQYVFCADNPVNMVDPYGLWAWDADILQWGVGSMLGFNGADNVGAAWSGAGWGASEGAAAALDGIIPFGDPLSDAYTDECGITQDGTEWSRALGETSRKLYLATVGLRGLSKSEILNHNRYLRIGPGRWGKDMVPRISIGNGPPSWLNHWPL